MDRNRSSSTLAAPPSLEDLTDTVICPACHVAVGTRCITRAGKAAREPHGRRFEAVEQAAGITQHRATSRREAQARGYTSNGFDHKTEQALLTAYAARINARASLDGNQARDAEASLTAPAPLDGAALEQVLRTVAGHLDAMNPDTIMSRETLHTEVQVAVWDHHGTYDNVAVGPDINTVLGHIQHLPLVGTRAKFAVRLRSMLDGVTV